jgi:hypothetical protein
MGDNIRPALTKAYEARRQLTNEAPHEQVTIAGK